jgi:hypothetical protein
MQEIELKNADNNYLAVRKRATLVESCRLPLVPEFLIRWMPILEVDLIYRVHHRHPYHVFLFCSWKDIYLYWNYY